jgi:hypothetical protein
MRSASYTRAVNPCHAILPYSGLGNTRHHPRDSSRYSPDNSRHGRGGLHPSHSLQLRSNTPQLTASKTLTSLPIGFYFSYWPSFIFNGQRQPLDCSPFI